MSKTIIINSDTPLCTEHVCYYTKSEGKHIVLYECVKETYADPQAPSYSTIFIFNIKIIKTCLKNDSLASNLLLMDAIETSIVRENKE